MAYRKISFGVRRQTRQRESEVLRTIQEGIDLHFSLFQHPGKLSTTEDNRVERVWLNLTTSGFHSLRIATYALESGYYSQCFTLTRAALEDWLTAYDCINNPGTVKALDDAEGRVPTFTDMAARLPEKLKILWKAADEPEGTYGFLSTFAHPRTRALQATFNDSGMLLIVPAYNEIRFALAARLLLQTALLLLEFVERLADYLATPASNEWKVQSLNTVKPRCFTLLASLLDRLDSYISDP